MRSAPLSPAETDPAERAYEQILHRANTAALTPDIEDPIRFATPGEAAVLLLGTGWTLVAERLASIPREYASGSEVLQIQTIIVSNDDGAWLACRTTFFDDNKHTHRSTRTSTGTGRSYYYDGLTAPQRANAVLDDLVGAAIGVGPDGLFSTLATAVETGNLGADPTNWIDAAALLLDLTTTETVNRDAMDAAAFLASFSYPRFTTLLNHARP